MNCRISVIINETWLSYNLGPIENGPRPVSETGTGRSTAQQEADQEDPDHLIEHEIGQEKGLGDLVRERREGADQEKEGIKRKVLLSGKEGKIVLTC